MYSSNNRAAVRFSTSPFTVTLPSFATSETECGSTQSVWELYGIVSDRDVAEAYAAAAVDGRTAGDSAGEPILAVQSDEELRRAAQLLAEHAVSHLLVTDPRTHRPVGVLSTLDLARSIHA